MTFKSLPLMVVLLLPLGCGSATLHGGTGGTAGGATGGAGGAAGAAGGAAGAAAGSGGGGAGAGGGAGVGGHAGAAGGAAGAAGGTGAGGSAGGAGCGDIATSAANCGACGHSCGGGACNLGVCQPAALNGITASSISVDQTQIYFSQGNKLLACPKTGCVLQPTQLDDMGMDGYPVSNVLVTNGSLFFVSAPTQATERDSVFMCPLAGCPSPAPTIVHSGLQGLWWYGNAGNDVYYSVDGKATSRLSCQPNAGACTTGAVVVPETPNVLAANDSEIYFVDTLGLQKCPYAGCPGTTATATGGTVLTSMVPTSIAYFAATGLIYMTFGDANHFGSGAIRTCTTASCDTQTPKTFASGRDVITGLKVDAQGVYWVETSTLYTCPITGCVGGPRMLATGITAMNVQPVTDDAFVYWIDDAAGTVKRVAK